MRMAMGEPVGTLIHLGRLHENRTHRRPRGPAFNSAKEVENQREERMEKALGDLQHEMATIRTGRAL